MTVYEVAKEYLGSNIEMLSGIGLLNKTLSHRMMIYSKYIELVRAGTPKMQARTEISEQYHTPEDSVCRIIREFGRKVDMRTT
jgi:hypothetical protein